MDMRIELVVLPVSDVERAKNFYTDQVGFHLDHDASPSPQMRVVQLTPPGSACSITVGTGLIDTPPGSVQALHLVVDDVEAARAELVGRGVEVGEVTRFPQGVAYAAFKDPDGNGWTLQEFPH